MILATYGPSKRPRWLQLLHLMCREAQSALRHYHIDGPVLPASSWMVEEAEASERGPWLLGPSPRSSCGAAGLFIVRGKGQLGSNSRTNGPENNQEAERMVQRTATRRKDGSENNKKAERMV